jgi:hypothetical protein
MASRQSYALAALAVPTDPMSTWHHDRDTDRTPHVWLEGDRRREDPSGISAHGWRDDRDVEHYRYAGNILRQWNLTDLATPSDTARRLKPGYLREIAAAAVFHAMPDTLAAEIPRTGAGEWPPVPAAAAAAWANRATRLALDAVLRTLGVHAD